MFLKAALALTLLAGIACAQDYYKADPAKLAQLEAQRCSKLYNEGRLIRTRLAAGNNHSYDVEKMKARLAEVDSDAGKYCQNWQPPATPTPQPAAKPARRR